MKIGRNRYSEILITDQEDGLITSITDENMIVEDGYKVTLRPWYPETEQQDSSKDDDKKEIVGYLCKLVRMTRAGWGIADLLLDDENRFVTILYRNGYTKRVSVEGDSGIALIRDILKEIN